MPRLWIRLGALRISRSELVWFTGALVAIGVALSAFARLATLRWQSFETNSFDLAFFDQIIFNTSRGRWFETSFVSYNFAGQHLEPILLAYVPAYWLGAGPYFLTISQSAVAALAAIPLYFFARRLTHQPAIACAAVVAYLANPYLHRAIAFDFHPEVMAAFPVFLAAWAIVAERRWLAISATLSVLLFKEDTVFVALLLAGLMWVRGLRTEAKITGTVAVAYAVLAVLVLMPLVRDGESSDLVDRYGYLLRGDGTGGVVEGIFLAPLRAARVALHPEQVWTAGLFVFIGSLVAFRHPTSLLWIAPGVGLAVLSNHPQQQRLELHYAAELVPAIIVTGTLSANSLLNRLRVPRIAFAMAAPPVVAMLFLSPLAHGHGEAPSERHRAAVHAALAYIPASEDLPVSAQSGLLPRLSQRRQAHEFPGHASKAEWMVIDRYGFRSSQSLAAGFDLKLEEIRRSTELVYSEDGVEVFRRAP